MENNQKIPIPFGKIEVIEYPCEGGTMHVHVLYPVVGPGANAEPGSRPVAISSVFVPSSHIKADKQTGTTEGKLTAVSQVSPRHPLLDKID